MLLCIVVKKAEVLSLLKIFLALDKSPDFNLVSKVVGIILLLLFFVCRVTVLPGFISTILALIWICYVPFGIGNIFMTLPIRYFNPLVTYLYKLKLASIMVTWCVGFFVTLVVFFIAHVSQLSITFLGPVLLMVSISSHFIPSVKISKIEVRERAIKILLISLALGISFGVYVRSFSPYPLSPGMDTFVHIYSIKNVLDSSLTNIPLVYLPSFDLLLALSSDTFRADLTQLFWTGSIMLFSFFSISLYVMCYWIIKSHPQAFIGCIIGLAATEQGLASNLQFFYPSSFVMCIFPITFFVVDSIWNMAGQHRRISILLTIVIFSAMIFLHFQLGVLASLMLSLYLISSRYIPKIPSAFFIMRITTIIIAVILFLYYWGYTTVQLTLHTFNSRLFESSHLYSTPTKVMHLNEWYTKEIMGLSLLGLIVLSLLREEKAIAIGFLSSIMLLIYFQQIGDIHRFMTLERPLLSFSAATLLMLPTLITLKWPVFMQSRTNRFHNLAKHTKSDISFFKRYLKLGNEWLCIFVLSRYITKSNLAYFVLVTIILFPVLMTPYNIYLDAYTKDGYSFVNFTGEELNAAKWIEKNSPKDYVIYSDPFTVIEMRGLAYRQNIEGIGWNITVAKSVKSAMISEDAASAYRMISSTVGKNVLIVITPRTSAWLRSSEYFVEAPVTEFRGFVGISKFFDPMFFKPQYVSNHTYIFTLR